MSLKNILFQQYAEFGLDEQLKTLQTKFKTKKGRRFNENNITYEIGKPKVVENSIEFEVSSKIPQDELNGKEGMMKYFDKVKKHLLKSQYKPVSVKMENIIWDADKETEKNRDYVKVNYRINFKDMYSENEIAKKADKVKENPDKHNIPCVPGITTLHGRLLLLDVKENLNKKGNETISSFIKANDTVQKELCRTRKSK